MSRILSPRSRVTPSPPRGCARTDSSSSTSEVRTRPTSFSRDRGLRPLFRFPVSRRGREWVDLTRVRHCGGKRTTRTPRPCRPQGRRGCRGGLRMDGGGTERVRRPGRRGETTGPSLPVPGSSRDSVSCHASESVPGISTTAVSSTRTCPCTSPSGTPVCRRVSNGAGCGLGPETVGRTTGCGRWTGGRV